MATPGAQPSNLLGYGDNLDVLRRHIAAESVDLVYLDPPFNSNADYNAFFAEQDGTRSAAQVKAFEDTWHWDQAAAAAFHDFIVAHDVPDRAKQAMLAFEKLVGHNDMLAYLAMMAPRLVELRRALKPSGSLYLHCDPTASHYLKILLDALFLPRNFKSEIIWRRTGAHVTSRRWPRLHDVILMYAKDNELAMFAPLRIRPDEGWIAREYRHHDDRGRHHLSDLTGAGLRNGPSGKPWRGIDPAAIGAGRHWRYAPETLDALDGQGRIHWPKAGRYPKLKVYLADTQGTAVGDIWTDIQVIGRTASERLGYPTQKPIALLERILQASSSEGDLVLDPFCGCGTTVAAAQKLGRRWIGIDITSLATSLIKNRLVESYGKDIAKSYRVIGEPVSVPDAEQLAASDPYQFQWWALGLVGARPLEQKKGADKGVDGRLYFHDEGEGRETKQVIFSVKAGKNVSVPMVRDLGHVVDREKAQIGVLLTMHEPTGPMRTEAAGAGFYVPPGREADRVPRLQILTIADLLGGRQVALPRASDFRTFKKAPKIRRPTAERTGPLPFGAAEEEVGDEDAD